MTSFEPIKNGKSMKNSNDTKKSFLFCFCDGSACAATPDWWVGWNCFIRGRILEIGLIRWRILKRVLEDFQVWVNLLVLSQQNKNFGDVLKMIQWWKPARIKFWFSKKQIISTVTLRTGFEPVRAEHNGFQVHPLNQLGHHSFSLLVSTPARSNFQVSRPLNYQEK